MKGPLFLLFLRVKWNGTKAKPAWPNRPRTTGHHFLFFFPFSLSSFPFHFFYSFPCVCRHSVLARFLLSEKQNDDGRGDKQQDPDYIDGHKTTTTTTTTGELLTTDLRARLARLIDFSVRDGQRGPGHWPSSSPSVVWPLCCLWSRNQHNHLPGGLAQLFVWPVIMFTCDR